MILVLCSSAHTPPCRHHDARPWLYICTCEWPRSLLFVVMDSSRVRELVCGVVVYFANTTTTNITCRQAGREPHLIVSYIWTSRNVFRLNFDAQRDTFQDIRSKEPLWWLPVATYIFFISYTYPPTYILIFIARVFKVGWGICFSLARS